MRILITNDDGIQAEGLAVMEAIATELAGADGEVWTVAPAFEQSGVAHCISYAHPTMISQFGARRFAVEGSPADCVLAGIYEVMKDTPPELVLSGVNKGNNSAENTVYSGTLGAAMEAAVQGIPAIGLSQFYGPDNALLDNPFEASAKHGVEVIRKILDTKAENSNPYELFFNVNFPPVPAAAVKGTKVVPQGRRAGTNFGVELQERPNRRKYLWVTGGDQRAPSHPGTDVAVNLEGYISVTPMRADLTAHDMLDSFRGIE
jgi:5'-nucleotidase